MAKKGVEQESVALEEDISGVYEAVEDMFNDQSDGGKVLAYRGTFEGLGICICRDGGERVVLRR